MKVEDVMAKWNAKVPFPWTPSKLRRAGFEPSSTLRTIALDLIEADDYLESPTAQKIVKLLEI